MARGLDHIVHAVRDLDAAGALYEGLGFTVGGRNRHPWGTHNRVIQLPSFFIELLTVAEPDKLGTDVISTRFGAFHRRFLGRGEGLSMLLLASADAAADAAAFAAAGIALSPAARFGREGARPDGSTVTLAFSLAFAGDPAAPEVGFAVCQHHFPENFWNPAFQAHRNTACAVAGVVLVADAPDAHRPFLAAWAGAEPEPADGGLRVETPRGTIEVATPARYRARFAADPPVPAGLAALRLSVRDRPAAERILAEGDIAFVVTTEGLVVPSTMGATLVLVPA